MSLITHIKEYLFFIEATSFTLTNTSLSSESLEDVISSQHWFAKVRSNGTRNRGKLSK